MEETRKLFSQLVGSITGESQDATLSLVGKSEVLDDECEIDELTGRPFFDARFSVQIGHIGDIEESTLEEIYSTCFLELDQEVDRFIHTAFSDLLTAIEELEWLRKNDNEEEIPRDVLGLFLPAR